MSTDSENAVNKIFGELGRELQERQEREAVPEEFRHMFQPMDIGAGGDAFFGDHHMMAVCLKCGAIVYPTALDRHSKFHEELQAK